MRRRKRGIQTALQIGANKDIDFLQTCLQQLLQIGIGVKHLLTLMLTALGRVFSLNMPLLPLSLSPTATASPTASLSSSSSTAWWLHLCFSQEPQLGQRITATCKGCRQFCLFTPFPLRRFRLIPFPTQLLPPLTTFSLFAIPIPHPYIRHQGPPLL